MADDMVKSLKEWLASWPNGSNWSDASGETVPIAKSTLAQLVDVAEAARDVERAFTPVTDGGHGLLLATSGVEAERRVLLLQAALARLEGGT